jgi:hypothetical protein
VLVPVSNVTKACEILKFHSCKIILNGNGCTGISLSLCIQHHSSCDCSLKFFNLPHSVNKKDQLDASVGRHLFTPTSNSTCFGHHSAHPKKLKKLFLLPLVQVMVLVPKHVEFDIAVNKCLHTDASSWSFLLTLNHDARNHEFKTPTQYHKPIINCKCCTFYSTKFINLCGVTAFFKRTFVIIHKV